jgi:transposase
MLSLPSSVRIYVASGPVDLRKGFYKLAALARAVVKEDPLNGHIFVFLNRRRNSVKALWWDRTGWLLLYKKLEVGTFQLPTEPLLGQSHIEVDAVELALMLEGIELQGAKRRRRWRQLPHERAPNMSAAF